MQKVELNPNQGCRLDGLRFYIFGDIILLHKVYYEATPLAFNP